MPTTTQLVISGQSRPGVMAQVASVLGSAGVNIKAFSAPEVTGTGKLRLLAHRVIKHNVGASVLARASRKVATGHVGTLAPTFIISW